MNSSKNKRVILINGDSSKWYEQAIFIVKKNIPEKHIPLDFVAEAEKVVNSYMLKTAYRKNTPVAKKKNSEGAEMLISILIIAACISLVVMLFFLM